MGITDSLMQTPLKEDDGPEVVPVGVRNDELDSLDALPEAREARARDFIVDLPPPLFTTNPPGRRPCFVKVPR